MPISYRAAQTLIKRGDEAALRSALDDGLDANLKNENGWTLLMLAAVEGALPLGEVLLAHGAEIAAVNLKGDTAKSIAERRGFAAFAAMLQGHSA